MNLSNVYVVTFPSGFILLRSTFSSVLLPSSWIVCIVISFISYPSFAFIVTSFLLPSPVVTTSYGVCSSPNMLPPFTFVTFPAISASSCVFTSVVTSYFFNLYSYVTSTSGYAYFPFAAP